MKNNRTQRGFTLIEAVVAAGVFAFAVSSVAGVYLAVVQLDSKTRSERTVQQNARFISEFLGKEVRNGSMNYPAYPGGSIPYDLDGSTSTLRIVNQSNEVESVSCVGENLVLTKAAGATNLNDSRVRVTKCDFYISPQTNPFTPLLPLPPPNQQPFVTVVLELTANYGTKVTNTAVLNIQSTFTVRDYPTRE